LCENALLLLHSRGCSMPCVCIFILILSLIWLCVMYRTSFTSA
jgi:hypothetical protein